jgi:hypothetical protein
MMSTSVWKKLRQYLIFGDLNTCVNYVYPPQGTLEEANAEYARRKAS